MNLSNLINKRFDKWIVICRVKLENERNSHWLCHCDCGSFKIVNSTTLKNGQSKSCGCRHKEITKNNLQSLKFGKLTVLEDTGTTKNRNIIWKCRCDCGNTHYVKGGDLTSGYTLSCGCHKNKLASERRGNKHPNYIDLPEEDRLKRKRNYTLGYKTWKTKVHKRDNNQCIVCKSNKKLRAHHIYNWVDYPELRILVSNGITLCIKCHNNFHRIYGKRFNNPIQLSEFLKIGIACNLTN